MTKPEYGSDKLPAGVLNLTGVRPGSAFDYDGPAMRQMTKASVTITTTYEAIEKYILPPPLKVDRDLPPELTLSLGMCEDCRGFDGRSISYSLLLLDANAFYGDQKGRSGFEYVDALHGDKTEVDLLMAWGIYFGMLKKFADIRIVHKGDEVVVSVRRRGVDIIGFHLAIGEEFTESEVAAMKPSKPSRGLRVREIPDWNYGGYTDRSIRATTRPASAPLKVWRAECTNLDLNSLELDPMGEIPVLSIDSANVTVRDTPKEVFSELEFVADL